MVVFAGIFLLVFGAAGAFFVNKVYPNAKFMRLGYVLMSTAGVVFIYWAGTRATMAGLAAAIVLALGAVLGIVGALRKELRMRV